MRNAFNWFGLAFLIVFLTSCGNKNSSQETFYDYDYGYQQTSASPYIVVRTDSAGRVSYVTVDQTQLQDQRLNLNRNYQWQLVDQNQVVMDSIPQHQQVSTYFVTHPAQSYRRYHNSPSHYYPQYRNWRNWRYLPVYYY